MAQNFKNEKTNLNDKAKTPSEAFYLSNEKSLQKDLPFIINSWSRIPVEIKRGIVAMVSTVSEEKNEE